MPALSPGEVVGHATEAASLLKEINDYNVKSNYPAMTVLLARGFWQFKEPSDKKRVLEGLRKAGVPELPSGYDAGSKDRLTGEEIKSLVFGAEFRGSKLGSGDPYSRTVSAEGVTSVSIGSWTDSGISRIEDDCLCDWLSTVGYVCGAIFRTPGGTFEQKNQYRLVRPWYQFEFSVFK